MWVPDAYTQTGDRYVGRSEDYASRHVKIFGVQEPVAGKVYESEESDFRMESRLPKTYRYTYVRDHPSDWDGGRFSYSEAGIDEFGASCSATLTANASDEILAVDPLCDFDNPTGETGGIGEFSYADVILGENKTAREAVILLGEVLDERGTSGTDQITISDTDESWLFRALSGHQRIAFRLPADQVSVNPKKPEPAKKKEEDGKPQAGDKPEPGDLPHTGDPASMAALGMLAAGGIGTLGYGVSHRRKTR